MAAQTMTEKQLSKFHKGYMSLAVFSVSLIMVGFPVINVLGVTLCALTIVVSLSGWCYTLPDNSEGVLYASCVKGTLASCILITAEALNLVASLFGFRTTFLLLWILAVVAGGLVLSYFCFGPVKDWSLVKKLQAERTTAAPNMNLPLVLSYFCFGPVKDWLLVKKLQAERTTASPNANLTHQLGDGTGDNHQDEEEGIGAKKE